MRRGPQLKNLALEKSAVIFLGYDFLSFNHMPLESHHIVSQKALLKDPMDPGPRLHRRKHNKNNLVLEAVVLSPGRPAPLSFSASALSMEDGTTPASTKDKRLASYYDVNYLSRLTIWWMFPFIWRARQGRLHEDDFSLGKPEGANECHSQFTTYWTEELTKDKPSLLRALRRAFWHQVCHLAIVALVALYSTIPVANLA
jgi:hypothetical protein